MRPIDAEALHETFCQECIGECACCPNAMGDIVHMHCKLIEEAQTLSVESLIYANWTYSTYMCDPVYICSNCKCEIDEDVFDRIPNNRCPKCGARMNKK